METTLATVDARSAERLRHLVEANRRIVAELSLETLLRRVLESAREVAHARYAALLVRDQAGGPEHFLHLGMDPGTVAGIARMPLGTGLLAAVGDQPLRVASITRDPRAGGLPPGHPPMGAFLGVPIESASSVYGTLYLTDPLDAPEFSTEDVELVQALAATAGIAVQNARLYEEAQQRQEWLRVSSEVSTRLLAEEGDAQSTLRALASTVRRLARADSVLVMLPVPDQHEVLEVSFADGQGVEHLLGVRHGTGDSLARQAMQEGRGLVHDRRGPAVDVLAGPAAVPPVEHVMVFPLQGNGSARGAVVVARSAHGPFSTADLQMAEGFAAQVGLAMEIADARADRARVAVLEDRARIARELNDHVVQRLFAAGLTIQGAASVAADAATRRSLAGTVTNLDDTIRSIRTSIFDLRDPVLGPVTLRTRVLAVVIELTGALGETPVVEVAVGLEERVPADLAADVEAVLREALTALSRQEGPTPVTVALVATGSDLELTVTDRSAGVTSSTRPGWLTGLRRRAERRGGALVVGVAEDGGLRLRWTAPLP